MKKFNTLDAWISIENIVGLYDIYLNPHPVPITSQVKGKSVQFKVKSTNVICIKSEGRHKCIYLKEPIKSIQGELLNTSKIFINHAEKKLETLCSDLDSLQFRLMVISRSEVVNVGFYDLNKNKLQLNLDNYQSTEDCKNIKIGKAFVETFIEKKETYESIVSLQKKNLRDKK